MNNLKFKFRNQFLLAAMVSFSLLYAAMGQINTQEIHFRKKEISVDGSKIIVELAESQVERSLGLMHRKSLATGYGMLFIFESERPLNFWMKNTFIPLSIGFFDKNKLLVDVQDMEPVKSAQQLEIPSYESKKPAQYALEVNRGWFKANKLKVGVSKLKID